MRLVLAAALGVWAGSTLLLSSLRWFNRPSLTDRLRPYVLGRATAPARGGVFSVASFRDVIGPLATRIGARFAAAVGIDEDLALRLERIHSPIDPAVFRVRQLGFAATAFAGGLVLALVADLPPAIGVLFVLGLPALGLLIPEQRLAMASAQWQRHIVLELPVVAEQLGMLLSAGYSLGAALQRLARRGKGRCGRDLTIVCARIQHGLSEVDALREWATRTRVDALDRLVSVLRLNREAGDLGRLISEEARSIRRDLHRQLIESMERRGQQVWIPVTVATLVPGVIFVAVPFMEAMRLFTQS